MLSEKAPLGLTQFKNCINKYTFYRGFKYILSTKKLGITTYCTTQYWCLLSLGFGENIHWPSHSVPRIKVEDKIMRGVPFFHWQGNAPTSCISIGQVHSFLCATPITFWKFKQVADQTKQILSISLGSHFWLFSVKKKIIKSTAWLIHTRWR